MNIVIVAVGGQGALFASRVLGAVALGKGFDVKVSEVHGMSQRGGSVITHVRYGSAIASPIVEEGYGDMVIAMEMLEGLRAVPFLKKGGTMILNEQVIHPMPVITGKMAYPDDIAGKVAAQGITVHRMDALKMACDAGNSKVVNTVLLGAAAACVSGIDRAIWDDTVKTLAPRKYLDVNLQAFDKGYTMVKGNTK
ncbi:MAG: indolepyruvate oxidoreductase subunit beta [Chitinispirillaceae bacterium]|nr:indolepyruvate oxidoreductase subunit beta [Chitinispirillaceae bacterium]